MPPDPSGWPWPLNGVQKWFESLWNKVWEAAAYAARKVWEWLPSWIRGPLNFLKTLADTVWNALISFFKDPVGTLAGLARKVWDFLPDWIRGPINFLAQLAKGAWNAVWSFFKDPVGTLKAGWDAATKAVSGFVSDLWSKVSSGFSYLSGAVSGFFGSLWAKISYVVGGAVHSLKTAFDGGIKAIGGWVGDVLKGIVGALGQGLRGVFDWLLKSLKWVAQMICGVMNAVRAAITPILTPILTQIVNKATEALVPGSPPEEVEEATASFSTQLLKRLSEIPPAHSSPIPGLPELLAASAGVVGVGMLTVFGMESIATYLDMAHPAKMTGIMHTADSLLYSLNFPAMIGPIIFSNIWAGIILPLRYRWNQIYKPLIPEASHLARFRAKGLMNGTDYLENMSFQGYGVGFAATYQQDAARIPTVMELNQMVWREKVSLEAFRGALRVTGVREDFIPGYEELTKAIPPWPDLVTMVVREVIPPERFYEFMPMHGFSRVIAEWYWEMHWILLPLGEVRRARHRGHIDDDELDKYLVLHDYKPEPRPGIRTSDRDLARKLAWDLPGRIEARWMFRWGIRDRDGLKELLIKGGLDPEYADEVADAVAMNQFLREIRAQETNIKADLRDGFILEGTGRADLSEIGYPVAFVDYHIADALKDRERSHKKKLLDYYEDAYLKDVPTEPPFEDAVRQILVVPEVADLFIDEAYLRKYKKPPPVPDLTARLSKARADHEAQRLRVERLTEDAAEYAEYITETMQVYDARIAAVEAERAVEVRPPQIRRLESRLTILREQKEARMTAMAAALTSKQRGVLEAEVRLNYLAEMAEALEAKVAA